MEVDEEYLGDKDPLEIWVEIFYVRKERMVTQMGRKSKEEGIDVYVWLIHLAVQQKLTQHCKATILQ